MKSRWKCPGAWALEVLDRWGRERGLQGVPWCPEISGDRQKEATAFILLVLGWGGEGSVSGLFKKSSLHLQGFQAFQGFLSIHWHLGN